MDNRMNDFEWLRERAEELREEARQKDEALLERLTNQAEQRMPRQPRVVNQQRPEMDREIASVMERLQPLANLENEPASPTDSRFVEAARQGMETYALEQMQRHAARPGSYVRRDHPADCTCMMCSHRRASGRPTVNVACDGCGNHFNLNPALCADGYYVCRACRDARGEPNVPEQRQERCLCCDNTRVVALRNQDGRPVCRDCAEAGRHRGGSVSGYVYQVACRHCQSRTTFGTLALASRSLRDLNGTCASCGHYALGIEERRSNDPRLDAERQRERERQRWVATVQRETERATIPAPTRRPTFTSAEPPEDPVERNRRIRRGQLENQIRMAQAVGRDVPQEVRDELAEMDHQDKPPESFVARRKVELD